jgi:hypothetical protein
MSRAWRSRNTVGVLALTLAIGGTGFWAWTHYRLRPPERPLRIALTHSPPFAYVYANGSMGGFAVEVLTKPTKERMADEGTRSQAISLANTAYAC